MTQQAGSKVTTSLEKPEISGSLTTGAELGGKKHFPSITYHPRWPLLSRV